MAQVLPFEPYILYFYGLNIRQFVQVFAHRDLQFLIHRCAVHFTALMPRSSFDTRADEVVVKSHSAGWINAWQVLRQQRERSTV
jgi:hypothetical protein